MRQEKERAMLARCNPRPRARRLPRGPLPLQLQVQRESCQREGRRRGPRSVSGSLIADDMEMQKGVVMSSVHVAVLFYHY
jgi:hypothetical protein